MPKITTTQVKERARERERERERERGGRERARERERERDGDTGSRGGRETCLGVDLSVDNFTALAWPAVKR